jgi:hypothetical protein
VPRDDKIVAGVNRDPRPTLVPGESRIDAGFARQRVPAWIVSSEIGLVSASFLVPTAPDDHDIVLAIDHNGGVALFAGGVHVYLKTRSDHSTGNVPNFCEYAPSIAVVIHGLPDDRNLAR